MNRRELFQQLAGAIVMADVPVDRMKVIGADAEAAIAVFEIPTSISVEQATSLKDTLLAGFKGTPFEGIRTVVLCDGAQLTFLKASGEICDERYHRHLTLREHVIDDEIKTFQRGGMAPCRLKTSDLRDDLRRRPR